MTIKLENVGKRFENQWIFRGFTQEFTQGKCYAITGHNGSGKSTLLKVIAGMLTPNEGSVLHSINGVKTDSENALLYLTYCAPYMELPEELTVGELLDFHSSQRQLLLSGNELLDQVELMHGKQIRVLSSGMKQRLKLALAFYTKTNTILLDEPTANFDKHWENWYRDTIEKVSLHKLVVICSNQEHEYLSVAHSVISMA